MTTTTPSVNNPSDVVVCEILADVEMFRFWVKWRNSAPVANMSNFWYMVAELIDHGGRWFWLDVMPALN